MMSPGEEARRKVEEFAQQAEYRREFIVIQTVFLAFLPIIYAGFIFTYGDDLWTVNGTTIAVYSTAMDLPNAPESWGTFFLIVGVGVLVALFTRHDMWLAIIAALTALVVCAFMVSFATDYVRYDAPQALPAALVYGVVGLSFFNLSRLAWVSARHKVRL
ncbi:membrane protein [Gordonia phage Sour]|uniref:Membrane protein n=1 Tax=Gordonia phage Sour TaxID=2182349 RepID=A0A2U8UKI4_9CAUD|nr:membrane protein [Gordonia phage Sour]AWN04219.1 membrane protein [Gordonia phage Sour]